MKFILTKIVILLALVAYPIQLEHTSDEKSVYICNGNYSKKYHYNKSCRGLSNCKSTISEVSLSKAKNKGRKICGWED
ncbi:hypothetical protein FHS04_002060 [Mesoflavibacter sabulilitoris]|uniref:Uncharacterized protein n=1 Tax=Mesoflavibacter zeaxanthinifaciens subsp. sabulilitoris TaxID=1520893 RepID=A0A2T1NLY1_9FLAO|nr:hypothetical protein [Mesoflavibacter zeaxanthinifaciens]MBB3124537.1 hypothetical protein [Mesoflavibacter zeaxanthinifaciens subsp. sabulilitoris]PSG93905.1 hypothetical protein C7H61_01660 [Mesoflavibacter zeaxanthinifaciens subsp. sabulilitoris]